MFNIIPQQDLYDPWGRPGAGAPLIHAPTGQKFTRYSGSLQDKLVLVLEGFPLLKTLLFTIRITLFHFDFSVDNIVSTSKNKNVIWN